jgi:hypothetical protein
MAMTIQTNETRTNQVTPRRTQMKKYIIAAVAAVVATVSLSSVAEAGWRRHHGWYGHHHYWGGPRIVIRPAYYNDYCFIKKVRRYDDWGNVYIKRVRICG